MNSNELADLIIDTVNAYKRAVNLPETPKTPERVAGVVAGVENMRNNPNLSPIENHEAWMERMKADGWVYGEELSETEKTHPALLPYEDVSDFYKINDLIFLAIVSANSYR